MKVNLGCGSNIVSGYINVDINPLDDSVLQCDFEKDKLPFDDNSIDELQAIDVLEHINNLIPFLNECYRVLKDSGKFYIEVPKFPSDAAIADPTHVRYFVNESFKYIGKYENVQIMYKIQPWKLGSLSNNDSNNRIYVRLDK